MKQQTDTPKPGDVPSSGFASAEEVSSPPELQRSHRQERERRERSANNDEEEEEDASSDEEMRPGAVAVAGVFTVPTSPSVNESQGPSAIDEQSVILGELAEPFQGDEELRRRCQALEQIVNAAVIGTAIVDNNGAGDHDEIAAPSPLGRKGIGFLIGAALALLVVGVILGVTIPLSINNDKDSLSIDSVVTPTQSPAPTAASTACTSMDCLAEILLHNEVSDAEALQDDSSPQFLALRWLADNDPAVLDLDSTPTAILVERYVLAVLYFATSTEGGLNGQNFLLSASSVCEWKGVFCNTDALVVNLLLSKSNHAEVIVLISKFRIDSPVSFPFSFNLGLGD
jgi:hypothetical protein